MGVEEHRLRRRERFWSGFSQGYLHLLVLILRVRIKRPSSRSDPVLIGQSFSRLDCPFAGHYSKRYLLIFHRTALVCSQHLEGLKNCPRQSLLIVAAHL